jgi:hypothetical protein
MAKQTFKGLYLHFDALHADYAAAIVGLAAHHAAQGYSTALGINTNDAGTESIVKVSGMSALYARRLPWAGALKNVYLYPEALKVAALVKQDSWRYTPKLRHDPSSPGMGFVDIRKTPIV